MGYSCTAIASFAKESLMVQLQAAGPAEEGNCWHCKGQKYFEEQGREQDDGAVTGTVWRFIQDNRCHKVGSYRINSDGTIQRFPTATAAMRQAAKVWADANYQRVYNHSF